MAVPVETFWFLIQKTVLGAGATRWPIVWLNFLQVVVFVGCKLPLFVFACIANLSAFPHDKKGVVGERQDPQVAVRFVRIQSCCQTTSALT